MELTLVAVLLGSVLAGAPGGVPLEKITDSTMLPPGVSGTFIIDSRPVSCLGNVFFNALEDGALIGLYAATPQGLAVIANRTIPVPGTMLTFQNATRTDCGGDRLVFLGAGDRSSLTPQAGIYTFQNGAISPPLLETDMPLSDSDIQSFSSLDATELGIVADVSLFPATDKQVVVMRPFGGAPTIIADRSTVLPGQTQPLSILSRPILAGSDVFFHARTDFDVGIYRWRNGEGITIVADVDTPVPLSGQGNFGAFGIFTNLNGRVVFGATFAGGLGLFAFQAGDLEPVVLPGDLTAEGATLVSAFEPRGAGNLLTSWVGPRTPRFSMRFSSKRATAPCAAFSASGTPSRAGTSTPSQATPITGTYLSGPETWILPSQPSTACGSGRRQRTFRRCRGGEYWPWHLAWGSWGGRHFDGSEHHLKCMRR